MGYDVHEINDFDGLTHSFETWNRLIDQTPGAQFFQTLDWLQVYWKHFAADQRLRVLMVEDPHEGVIGIVPLVVRRDRRKLGAIRTLTFPQDDWGSFYGPLGSRPAETMDAVLRHVAATPRDWEVLSLRWLDATRPVYQACCEALKQVGLSATSSVRETTGLIRVHGSWDDYLQQRGSKFRNNYRRWMRRLEQLGEYQCEIFRMAGRPSVPVDPRWDLYDACVDVARRSWQGSSTTGTTLSHAAIAPFLRDCHAAAVGAGAVDLALMRINGSPVAFAYGYRMNGQVFSLRVGYDAAVNDQGIGNLMWLESIKDSFQRGDEIYDMGPGSLDYKKFYYTECRDIMQLDHYAATAFRAQAMRLKQTMFSSLQPIFCPASAANGSG